MADPQPPSRASDNSTRLDIKVQDARGARRPAEGDLESVEIPIHITGSELMPVRGGPPASGGSGEYVEEMPTEIFRPGMHPHPQPPQVSARSQSATRVAPAPQAGQQRQAPETNATRLSPQPRYPLAAPPPPPAPVSFEGLGGDDWDGETVVRQPAALTTSKHRERPGREVPREQARAAPAQQKPFNPDETVNLNDIDVDIDFSDETQHIAAPPRRPR